jgi:hypothetical protein
MSRSTRLAVHPSVGKAGREAYTGSILFRWPTDGQHVKARSYSETIWKPALVKAGVIAEPAKDGRSRRRYMLPCSHDRARAIISERFTRVIGPDS